MGTARFQYRQEAIENLTFQFVSESFIQEKSQEYTYVNKLSDRAMRRRGDPGIETGAMLLY